jgi:UDP-glucose 4-epimerase
MQGGIGRRVLVVGGAGFVGSHVVDRLLLGDRRVEHVRVYDNFSTGREWRLRRHLADRAFSVVRGDVRDRGALKRAMAGFETVIHLASNADIARAADDPDVDFDEGTCLTRNVLEAMRATSARCILYASGSGVYGDVGPTPVAEDYGPLAPISTYAASKIAGEALIAAYAQMFDLRGYAFRFANIVGPRQSHGVAYDFVRKLSREYTRLFILGDGHQRKSYVHVGDAVAAMVRVLEVETARYRAFNVATDDTLTVDEIADLALESLGLAAARCRREYSGGPRGWRGDVPVVLLDTHRLRSLGWSCGYDSRSAMREALAALVAELELSEAV